MRSWEHVTEVLTFLSTWLDHLISISKLHYVMQLMFQCQRRLSALNIFKLANPIKILFRFGSESYKVLLSKATFIAALHAVSSQAEIAAHIFTSNDMDTRRWAISYSGNLPSYCENREYYTVYAQENISLLYIAKSDLELWNVYA